MPDTLRFLVSGSRNYGPLSKVAEFVETVAKKYPHATLVHGGAEGVDLKAQDAAIDCKLRIELHPAQWDKFGHRAGFVRNEAMVRVAHHVVAFWDEFSRGTAHAIALAHTAGKLRAVYGATGKELPLDGAVRAAFKVTRRRPHRTAIAPEIRRLREPDAHFSS